MSIVEETFDIALANGIERGKMRLYGALLRKMNAEHKDNLTFEEIKAVFEEENNARKES